jgi:predicted RNA binding protein YcfA (HicA-like mRNA interferase family)
MGSGIRILLRKRRAGLLSSTRAAHESSRGNQADRGRWLVSGGYDSHRQYKHATKPGRVTVPDRPSDDLAPGTLNSILKQARLKENS